MVKYVLIGWKKNPHCHWCKRMTILSSAEMGSRKLPRNAATLDHVYTRKDARRTSDNKNQVVLACYDCNQRRGYRPFEEFTTVAKNIVRKKTNRPLRHKQPRGEMITPRVLDAMVEKVKQYILKESRGMFNEERTDN